jgi:hypothetical protein
MGKDIWNIIWEYIFWHHNDTINVTLALGMNEKIPIILSKAITEVQVCHQSLLSWTFLFIKYQRSNKPSDVVLYRTVSCRTTTCSLQLCILEQATLTGRWRCQWQNLSERRIALWWTCHELFASHIQDIRKANILIVMAFLHQSTQSVLHRCISRHRRIYYDKKLPHRAASSCQMP